MSSHSNIRPKSQSDSETDPIVVKVEKTKRRFISIRGLLEAFSALVLAGSIVIGCLSLFMESALDFASKSIPRAKNWIENNFNEKRDDIIRNLDIRGYIYCEELDGNPTASPTDLSGSFIKRFDKKPLLHYGRGIVGIIYTFDSGHHLRSFPAKTLPNFNEEHFKIFNGKPPITIAFVGPDDCVKITDIVRKLELKDGKTGGWAEVIVVKCPTPEK